LNLGLPVATSTFRRRAKTSTEGSPLLPTGIERGV